MKKKLKPLVVIHNGNNLHLKTEFAQISYLVRTEVHTRSPDDAINAIAKKIQSGWFLRQLKYDIVKPVKKQTPEDNSLDSLYRKLCGDETKYAGFNKKAKVKPLSINSKSPKFTVDDELPTRKPAKQLKKECRQQRLEEEESDISKFGYPR